MDRASLLYYETIDLWAWSRCCRTALLRGWQEQLELWWQFLFAVKAIGKVDPADAAIRVKLHAQGLDVVRAVRTSGKIRQVELNLVPTLVQSHRHGANEWLYSGGALVVGCAEASPNFLVIQDLHFECEVLLQVLDDHHQEWQLDSKRLVRVCWACDVGRADIRTHDLKNTGLNVRVGKTLDVAIAHLLVPDLKRLATDGVKDGQEARLVGVLEHGYGSAPRLPPLAMFANANDSLSLPLSLTNPKFP